MGLGVATLLATLLAAGGASGDERALVLEVIVNGRTTGRVGEFIERGGALYVKPSELRELGFVLPPDIAGDAAPIALSSLPDIRARVDEARQTLAVVAGDAALRPTELQAASGAALSPLSPSGYGVLLNYDTAATVTARGATGGALLDMRAFSPYGVLQSTGLAKLNPTAGQQGLSRLDTTFTYSEPDKLRRWRAGDVTTGALPWSRAVRLGGVQVASDFGLRPDLLTYPLPLISGSAAVPSTVDVMVDGIRQLSDAVPPGPFALRTLPVVTGAGEVAVTVSDALGRQTLITLPFYASTSLLRPGLGSYSFEAGAVRQDFGQSSDHYTAWAANGSARYGLTDWLTLEAHGEAAAGVGLIGGGAAALVGTLGVVNLAVAGSADRGSLRPRSGGGMVSAGFQRVSRRLSLSLTGAFATGAYRDIAAAYGAPMPKSMLNASFGYQGGRWGNIGLAYTSRVWRPRPPGSPFAAPGGGAPSDARLVTGSYSISVAHRGTFYVTGFKDLRQASSYGAGLGLSFPLGHSSAASVATSLDGGRSTSSVNIAKAAQEQNAYGYRLQASEGAAPHRTIEGEYLSRWSRLSVGADQSPGQIAGRAGARGALVLAGDRLFASDQINDSFAVVSTGEVAGVPVLSENRLVGKTDSHGKLLIPSLLSYQDNLLAVDAAGLPPDVEVGKTSILVRPRDRSGVPVDFRVQRVSSALLTLHDAQGRAIPIGSVAKVEGAEDRPVGHDGEAYVTGLKPSNRMTVLLPDGSRCVVAFDYEAVEGDIPAIGPLRCQ